MSAMSDDLLVVLAHSKASDALARHWPWLLKGECDILGVGREDTTTIWPAEKGQDNFIGEIRVGAESYASGQNHITRYLDVLRWCTDHVAHQRFCVIEYDCLIFKPLSLVAFKPGLLTTCAGGRSEGFRGSLFFHTPWWCDRTTACDIMRYGGRMLRAGLDERGFLDRWLGLLADLYDLRVQDFVDFWYTQNTIDTPEKIAEARRAIIAGAWGLHGCKTAAQLEAITRG